MPRRPKPPRGVTVLALKRLVAQARHHVQTLDEPHRPHPEYPHILAVTNPQALLNHRFHKGQSMLYLHMETGDMHRFHYTGQLPRTLADGPIPRGVIANEERVLTINQLAGILGIELPRRGAPKDKGFWLDMKI